MSSSLDPVLKRSTITEAEISLVSDQDPVQRSSKIALSSLELVSEIVDVADTSPPSDKISLPVIDELSALRYLEKTETNKIPFQDETGAIRLVDLNTDSLIGADGFSLPAYDLLGTEKEIPLLFEGSPSIYYPILSDVNYDYTDNGNNQKTVSFFYPAQLPPAQGLPVVIVLGTAETPFGATEAPDWFTETSLLPFLMVSSGYIVVWMQYTAEPYPEPQRQLQRCIQFLRQNASTYSLDADRIAVYGSKQGATIAGYTVFGPDAKLTSGETYPEELQSTRVKAAILEGPTSYWPAMVEATTGAHFGEDTLADVSAGEEEDASFINLIRSNPGLNDSMYVYLMSQDVPTFSSTSFPFPVKFETDLNDAWHVWALASELIAEDITHATESKLAFGLYDKALQYPDTMAWLAGKL